MRADFSAMSHKSCIYLLPQQHHSSGTQQCVRPLILLPMWEQRRETRPFGAHVALIRAERDKNSLKKSTLLWPWRSCRADMLWSALPTCLRSCGMGSWGILRPAVSTVKTNFMLGNRTSLHLLIFWAHSMVASQLPVISHLLHYTQGVSFIKQLAFGFNDF